MTSASAMTLSLAVLESRGRIYTSDDARRPLTSLTDRLRSTSRRRLLTTRSDVLANVLPLLRSPRLASGSGWVGGFVRE